MIEDVCANNHKGDSCSVAANPRPSRKQAMCDAIYEEAVRVGPKGAIAEDLHRPLGLSHQTGSARCSDLKASGLLLRTTRRSVTVTDSPATVLVAKIYATENAGELEDSEPNLSFPNKPLIPTQDAVFATQENS